MRSLIQRWTETICVFICLSVSLSICQIYLSVCLAGWLLVSPFVRMRLNGEVETLKCGNGDMSWFEKRKCKKEIRRAWATKGERAQTDGEEEKLREARRKRLGLLSGACLSVMSTEPQPENTDTAAVCISLPFITVTPIWTAISYVILLFWPIYRVT